MKVFLSNVAGDKISLNNLMSIMKNNSEKWQNISEKTHKGF